jgi:hypothetical protein
MNTRSAALWMLRQAQKSVRRTHKAGRKARFI